MAQTTDLPIELHDVRDLLERAQRGDREAVPALRTYLDGNSQIWQSAGDLAAQTEQVLIGVVSGSDLLRAESLRRKLESLKAELSGPTPTPIERLVAARAALSWLQVHTADLDATAILMRDGGATTLSLYAQRRLDSANRRYMQTLRSLEVIRRIHRPKRSPAPCSSQNGPRAKSCSNNGSSRAPPGG